MKTSEENIVHESPDKGAYVYKLDIGKYEIRVNKTTHSIVIGAFDMPDEDEDAFERAKNICDDYVNVERIIKKYQK